MSEEKWIPTSNILMDTLLKEGIPKDKITLLVGQSGVGNSYYLRCKKVGLDLKIGKKLSKDYLYDIRRIKIIERRRSCYSY
jgi:ABC-type phosphate transport system ATPase subunit